MLLPSMDYVQQEVLVVPSYSDANHDKAQPFETIRVLALGLPQRVSVDDGEVPNNIDMLAPKDWLKIIRGSTLTSCIPFFSPSI